MNKFAQKNKEFISRIINDHCGKLLGWGNKRKVFSYQRNRIDNTYYLTQIKGNWIKSFKIQHLLDEKSQNLFLTFMVLGLLDSEEAKENAAKTKTVKTLLVKTLFNEHEKHLQLFKQLTPDLCWDDEVENDNPTI